MRELGGYRSRLLLNDENGLLLAKRRRGRLGEIGAQNKIPALKASLSDSNSFVKIAAAPIRRWASWAIPRLDSAIA